MDKMDKEWRTSVEEWKAYMKLARKPEETTRKNKTYVGE
jgi:hypothetical protein